MKRIVILFLLPLFLVGCGYSRQEMNIMNQYCSKAEENAQKYINGKQEFKYVCLPIIATKSFTTR